MGIYNLNICKNITGIDKEFLILQLICKIWIAEESDELYNLADEKGIDIEDISEKDCIDFLKKLKYLPKLIKNFIKRNTFYIDNSQDFDILEQNGILDLLPEEMKIKVFKISQYEKKNIAKILERKNLIIYVGDEKLNADIFNMISIANLEKNAYSKINIDGLNISNMVETIRNINNSKDEFQIFLNINSNDDNDKELYKYIFNSLDEIKGNEISCNINIEEKEDLSDILQIINENSNKKNYIVINIKNDGIKNIEQINNLLNAEDQKNIYFNFSLTENYIASLKKDDAKLLDEKLEELKKSYPVSIKYIDDYVEDKSYKLTTSLYLNSIEECTKLYKKLQEIILNVPIDASDLDKVTYISNWIVNNISYNYSDYYENKTIEDEGEDLPYFMYEKKIHENSGSLPNLNLYQKLFRKDLVCEDIALLTEFLCKKVGVKCEYIDSTSGRHSFNIVYIENKPYWLDNTWEVNLHDEDKEYSLKDSQYFLTSSNVFSRTHSKYDVINQYACPNSIAREDIARSLERIKLWRNPMERSLIGNGLYSKITIGEFKHTNNELRREINVKKNIQRREVGDE